MKVYALVLPFKNFMFLTRDSACWSVIWRIIIFFSILYYGYFVLWILWQCSTSFVGFSMEVDKIWYESAWLDLHSTRAFYFTKPRCHSLSRCFTQPPKQILFFAARVAWTNLINMTVAKHLDICVLQCSFDASSQHTDDLLTRNSFVRSARCYSGDQEDRHFKVSKLFKHTVVHRRAHEGSTQTHATCEGLPSFVLAVLNGLSDLKVPILSVSRIVHPCPVGNSSDSAWN